MLKARTLHVKFDNHNSQVTCLLRVKTSTLIVSLAFAVKFFVNLVEHLLSPTELQLLNVIHKLFQTILLHILLGDLHTFHMWTGCNFFNPSIPPNPPCTPPKKNPSYCSTGLNVWKCMKPTPMNENPK